MTSPLIAGYLSARAARYPRETPPEMAAALGVFVLRFDIARPPVILTASQVRDAIRTYRAMVGKVA